MKNAQKYVKQHIKQEIKIATFNWSSNFSNVIF